MPISDTPPTLARHLLVAVPQLDDPHFSRTVALICQHDANGAMGIVVNRASDMLMGELLKQIHIDTQDETQRMHQVLAGGPVHPERGFVLHRAGKPYDASYALGDDLVLTTSRDILEAMAKGNGPERALVALGFAGWEAGQLEAELADNSWMTVPADEEVLFDLPLEQRWQVAANRLGVDLNQMAGYSGRA